MIVRWFELCLSLLASPLFIIIIIIINFFPLGTLLCCYLFVNVYCTLCIPACSHILYHSPYSKLLRKSFGFYAIKITRQLTGPVLAQLLRSLVADLASYTGRGLLFSHDRLQASICQMGLAFHLIIVHKGKKIVHMHKCC